MNDDLTSYDIRISISYYGRRKWHEFELYGGDVFVMDAYSALVSIFKGIPKAIILKWDNFEDSHRATWRMLMRDICMDHMSPRNNNPLWYYTPQEVVVSWPSFKRDLPKPVGGLQDLLINTGLVCMY